MKNKTLLFLTERIEESGSAAEDVFAGLAEAFKKEPHLLETTTEDLKRSFLAGLSVVGFNEERKPICHARLIPLIDGWYELGGTYVHPDYRGQGVNHAMYRRLLAKHCDKDILATTTNPISLRVGEDLGFVLIPRRKLPERVWRASCVCSSKKTRSASPDKCALAFGESNGPGLCYFRTTPETADRHGLR